MTAAKKKATTRRPPAPAESASPPEASAALGQTLDFMRLLWAVDHGLQSRSKRMDAELGVTGVQRMVIRIIGRFPGITAGHVADLLHVDPSSLTEVFKRLASRGLVRRSRDLDDARLARFSLLAPGTKIDGTKAGTIEAAVRRTLARMPPDTLDAAREVLEAVTAELARVDR